MREDEVRKLFRQVYNGQRNLITPNVVRYGVCGEYCYELSKGQGIYGEVIFGVTVLTTYGRKCHELSRSFMDQDKAEDHIKKLRLLEDKK